MAEIVAFEGKRSAQSLVAWGTAAVRDGDVLRNPTRRTAQPFVEDDFQSLIGGGALTALPQPVKIPAEDDGKPLVVLEIKRELAVRHELKVDPNRIAVTIVATKHTVEHSYYVFDSQESFRQAAEVLVGQILHSLLYCAEWSELQQRLLRAAMALDAHDPIVNALRAVKSQNPETFLLVARSNLRTQDAREVFEIAWTAFSEKELRYVLKYKDGLVRSDGGMGVGNVAKLMRAIVDARPGLAAAIEHKYPFLQHPPETELYDVKAASAEFRFSVPDVSLGERFARYLELKLFEQALDGQPLEVGAKALEFFDAVRQIAQPDGNTVVSQGFGAEPLRPVQTVVDETDHGEAWSAPLTLLGYQSGLVRDTERIEINVFPGMRLLVSSTDNGGGAPPLGVEFLQTTKDFLYRPALYRLQRRRLDGSDRFFLQEVIVLKPGAQGLVTAVHSSLVRGAYVYNLKLPVVLVNANRLRVGSEELTGANARAIGDAREWMLRYEKICRDVELHDSRHSRLVPVKLPQVSPLLQILSVLDELGGSARQVQVLARMNDRYKRSALLNNTRREVLHHKDLVTFDPEDKRKFVLTETGALYLAAYERIARRVQQ